LEILRGRDHFRDISIPGGMIVKLFFKKYSLRMWAWFIWLRIGPIHGPF
jgi:hypothetical protein